MPKNKKTTVPKIVRTIGAIWGVTGVMLLLGSAVYRLLPFIIELFRDHIEMWQVAILIAWCAIMVYSEGYKAFGKQFSPRVVARAQYLSRTATWPRIILAPLFCVGYFGASRKRIIASTALTTGVVGLILVVHTIAQPWRGIIDSGVVLGLACGILYLLTYSYQALRQKKYVANPAT